jgi:hypothetical protein
MSADTRAFALKNGHAPVADKVVCVDFDGTLFPFGEIYSFNDPLPGAVEAMTRLREAGMRIVIFTSRLSPTWLEAEYGNTWAFEAEAQRHYIGKQLDRFGIPFDLITCEKVPAIAYIDDKALRFDGFNWFRLAAIALHAGGKTWLN